MLKVIRKQSKVYLIRGSWRTQPSTPEALLQRLAEALFEGKDMLDRIWVCGGASAALACPVSRPTAVGGRAPSNRARS